MNDEYHSSRSPKFFKSGYLARSLASGMFRGKTSTADTVNFSQSALFTDSMDQRTRRFFVDCCGMRIIETAKFVLIILVMITAACDGARVEPEGPVVRTLTDDLGRSVKLPLRVARIVSLAPSVTEMIFAAGAGDRLVGVTTYCNYPEAAKAIEKVGDTQTPNIERIIALKPDVVFVSTASQLEAFMQTLEQQNIAVYVTDPKGIDGVAENLSTFGRLFGTETTADRLAGELKQRATAVNEQVKARPRSKVFVQISNEPLFTIGKEAFVTALVERAGGESVSRDVPTAFPKLSKETASAMSPEVIILSDSEDNLEPNEVFRNSPAVKNGRVYRINADIISRPGPRLVDALEQIAGFLHQ
jgi:ABC-type Fe3+-hydroxamate transport system substrate-binding protein